MIRPCRAADAAALCDIYNYHVRETMVTFEEEPVASVALHERPGFREIGRFPEAGRKPGRWVDVGYRARVDAGSVPAA